jgi:ankyrin repeat protein
MASGKISTKQLDEGLFWGCATKRDQLLQILLKSGANANAVEERDNERITTLMVAVRWRNKEAVETLIKAGARAGARDKYGETELTTLLNDSQDQTQIVVPLLESGVGVNAANIYGLTALMRASRAQPGPVLELLIKHEADVNAKDYRGDTALSVATENGNDAAMRILVKTGAKR